jgi:mannose-6-phosphate isomerase-like protein (cupin superfamily)
MDRNTYTANTPGSASPTRTSDHFSSAAKKAILADGCTDPIDYCYRKGGFVTEALRQVNQQAGVQSMEKVNLREKLALFTDRWSPKVVGELNGQQVRLVKLQGEFVWHKHDGEDELFLVVQGRFRMEFRDRHVWLGEGEFLIIPRGVEHRPVADEEAHVLLFEPASTLNTGNVRNERTVGGLPTTRTCWEPSGSAPVVRQVNGLAMVTRRTRVRSAIRPQKRR